MTSHTLSSPDTMTSKGGLGDSPVSSRSGMNGHLGDAEKNGAFVHERAQEYSSEPWQDNRSVFRKLKDWWLVELLGCLLSIGASCAIIFILLYYDGQPLPSWPHKVTLNSILALLTTVAKSGLTVPIGAAIGQLKWIWFAEKERPLADFQTFDEASRGPIGGLKLIGRLKGIHLACIGAVVSILGFGTSFITQQMIAYPTRPVSNRLNTSFSDRSDLFYARTHQGQNTAGYTVDYSLKDAAQSGLFHPYDQVIPTIAPTCATGNCTWEPYRTLQICSKTANVTDKLTYTPLEYNAGDVNKTSPSMVQVSLPNGALMNSTQYLGINMTHVDKNTRPAANRSIAFLDIPNVMDVSIANIFLIFKNDRQEQFGRPFIPHSAIEILFYWCVGEHDTQVVDGIPSSNPIKISTDVKTMEGVFETSPDIIPDPLTSEDTRHLIEESALVLSGGKDKQENYTVDRDSRETVRFFLSKMMEGTTYSANADYGSDGAEVITTALFNPVTIGKRNGSMTFQQERDLQLKTVNTLVANIATSLSNNIRSRPFRGTPAIGTAYIGQSYVEVRWPWLSYLLALLLLSFVLLAGTIYKTKVSRVKVIKSSALAVMYGSSEKLRGNLRHLDERQRMVQLAEQSNARLVNGGGGWHLTSTR